MAVPPSTDTLHELQDEIRRLFATIINVPNHNNNQTATTIAMHPSTAFAITLAAENILTQFLTNNNKFEKGRILILQDQMCSAVYPWQAICERSQGRLQLDVVSSPGNEISNDGINGMNGMNWTTAVLERLTEQRNLPPVVAACLPPLHWSDGSLLDLKCIGSVCKERQIRLIVDSTQATGIYPDCSVADIQPAMMACSVHKWLRGPNGIALVYIDPNLHDQWTPLDQHGRGRAYAEGGTQWEANPHKRAPDDSQPQYYPEVYYKDARKFDCGGKPNAILLPMLVAALQEVARIDTARAQRNLQILFTPLYEWAKCNGFEVALGDPHAHHLIGIRPRCLNEKQRWLSPTQMLEVADRLKHRHGIILAVRCHAFRISPYLDTRKDDVRRLLHALRSELPAIPKQ